MFLPEKYDDCCKIFSFPSEFLVFFPTSPHAKFQRILTTIQKLYVHTSVCAVLHTDEKFVALTQVSTEHITNPFQKRKNSLLSFT